MKSSLLLSALLLLFVVGTVGCYGATFEYPDRQPGQVVDVSRTFYVAGLFDGNKRPVVAHEVCGGPVQSVQTVNTFGNMCLGCVTAQIYTPNTVRVTCAAGAVHNFYLDEDDVVVGHETVDAESGEVVQREFHSDLI
ncbi:MAG: Bor/Iss family lipoprotein [Bradymonadaceae bacterium]